MASGALHTAYFSEERKPSADIPSPTEEDHRPFSRQFPKDVLRIILETAADPGDGTFASLSDKGHLKFVHDLCLIDKYAASWIEPLLHKAVVLESDKQVVSFSYALKCKGSEFLSRYVRALWILHDSKELNRINFGLLFSTLHRLESLALPGDKVGLLHEISSPSPIRDLILVKPRTPLTMWHLRNLFLRSLHIIDPSNEIVRNRTSVDEDYPFETFVIQLSAIPRICLDFTTSPRRLLPLELLGRLAELQFYGEKLQTDPQSPNFAFIPDVERLQEQQAQPTSLWVKRNSQTIERRSMPHSAWISAIALCEQYTPCNRQAYSDSPLSDLPEYQGAYNRSGLQLIKEMMRYNEVHWDRVAELCEDERARRVENRT